MCALIRKHVEDKKCAPPPYKIPIGWFLLEQDIIKASKGGVISMTRAAEGLGVPRQVLSDLVNERTGISTEMAIRLSKAFGSTPETWLGMQMAYDLWQARERAEQIEIERFAMPATGR